MEVVKVVGMWVRCFALGIEHSRDSLLYTFTPTQTKYYIKIDKDDRLLVR